MEKAQYVNISRYNIFITIKFDFHNENPENENVRVTGCGRGNSWS